MPRAISGYFLSEPDYLLVYYSSQIYYNVWGFVSSVMDVSDALSYSYEDHFYVGRWNHLHLLSLLCAAAGLARLSMAWLEAIQFTDYRNEEGADYPRLSRIRGVVAAVSVEYVYAGLYSPISRIFVFFRYTRQIGPCEYECLCMVFW